MRIAITGCDGFIGSYLTKRLEKEVSEIIKIDFKYGFDITKVSTLKSIPKFDVLIHLAAKSFVPQSYKSPQSFYEVNILGTLNALELCRQYDAKMLFTSSYVYGVPKYLPIDENHPLVAFNPYSQSKIIGEQLCQGYHRDFKTNISIVRPFNIFGLGQNEFFLIPSILKQAKTGIVKLDDPTPKRDFVYIKDLIEAYLKIIYFESDQLEIFNIGSGKSYSIVEIANQITNSFPKKIELYFSKKKRTIEINDTIANIENAEKQLKWKPKFSFYDGLKDYFESLENKK